MAVLTGIASKVILLVFTIVAVPCSAQVYTFSVNPHSANPFGFSTSIYQTSWGAGGMIKFHGDCYQFWRTAAAHVTPPSYMGFHKQTGCTGAYVAYGGASVDLGDGSSCMGGPPGTLFCDNSRNNGLYGCSLGIDTHNDKLVCLFFDQSYDASVHNGLWQTSSSNGTTWTPPVVIPNRWWVGGNGYMKGATKFCFYAAGNHRASSQGDQYEMCTTDDVTWTNDAQISTNLPSEGTVWYDSTGTNGLVVVRNNPPNPLYIGTTTNGGATWTVGYSNITGVTPACVISGGTLTQDSFPAPFLFSPTNPAGQVTLLVADRQTCTGSPGAMNHYLLTTTFDPMTVIANPSSLPPTQILWTGPQTNASVDCGYAGMLQTSGTAVTFGWYCSYPAFSLKPVILQMTGAYATSQHDATIIGGNTIIH